MSNKSITSTQTDEIFDGIDVSSYQGEIDFNRVKASGIDAVYIKAGEGGGITDPYYKQNYLRAERAGLISGPYFYVTARTPEEARTQATDFFNLIRETSFNARPAMDFENFEGLERNDINAVGLAFLEELENLTGVTPMIYTDASNARNVWSEAFSRYPLWIADYSMSDDFPSNISVWDSWTGFQYSDSGRVPGISGNVDLNRFREGILISIPDSPVSPGRPNTVAYIVRRGDTLSAIARNFGVSAESIASANRLQDPDVIMEGQTLIIPQNSGSENGIFHTVAAGDTLWNLARRYETTVPAIARLNGITDPAQIYIGQVLRIPN